MKKILFPSLFIFLFTSCSSSDDDKVTLDKTSISIYADETSQLTANEKVDWDTDDIFVASVDDNGLVEGFHVGETFIIASSKNGEAKCHVEVKAKYNTYTEPLFDFGLSKSNIKSKEKRNLSSETTTSLIFTPKESSLSSIIYMFKDDKMTSAGAVVKLSSAMAATDFLLERYLVVSAGEGGFAGVMINNIPSKATMTIAAAVESNYYLVMYVPYTLSRNASQREEFIKELTKKYVDLLND